jgi:hypothetical protein
MLRVHGCVPVACYVRTHFVPPVPTLVLHLASSLTICVFAELSSDLVCLSTKLFRELASGEFRGKCWSGSLLLPGAGVCHLLWRIFDAMKSGCHMVTTGACLPGLYELGRAIESPSSSDF